jgi:hypothetical protein
MANNYNFSIEKQGHVIRSPYVFLKRQTIVARAVNEIKFSTIDRIKFYQLLLRIAHAKNSVKICDNTYSNYIE